ncbi:hypothetical protein I314_00501, partial [Cryptococcus bacillisporus CA1873]
MEKRSFNDMLFENGPQSSTCSPDPSHPSRSNANYEPAHSDASRPVIVNRACDECHRLKMRCTKDNDSQSCTRCLQGNRPCRFEGPRKSKTSKVEDRLRVVEGQISSIQGNIEELLRLQRDAARKSSNLENSDPFVQKHHGKGFETKYIQRSSPQNQDMPSRQSGVSTLALSQADNHLHQKAWDIESERGLQEDCQSNLDVDLFTADQTIAPLGNMLSLAEAARLKADAHIVRQETPDSAHTAMTLSLDTHVERPIKKTRFEGDVDDKIRGELKLVQKGNHSFPDPVDLGWCSLSKGKELFGLFFDRCAPYVPCFDPSYDTWDSLRSRSPFAITTIIYVAQRCVDAGGELNNTVTSTMSTLFTPVARNEIVQSMKSLIGHAVRMAMDLGLHHCLPYLTDCDKDIHKSHEELTQERHIVTGARIWLTLFKIDTEMSFAYCRPAIFSPDEATINARRLLKHPLSIPTDIRLVSTCENLAFRMPLHQHFALSLGRRQSIKAVVDVDQLLRGCNCALKDWFEYWDSYCAQRGISADHFLRETLVTGRAGTILNANSYVLHDVRNRRDLMKLSEERRHWFQEAGEMAHQLVNTCVRGQQYTENFRYANRLTHYNMVYAARFMIRMASLLPEACDLHKVGRDVEQVAVMLSQVPGFQLAHSLREIISKAKQDHVLPSSLAVSRAPSPSLAANSIWSGANHDGSENYLINELGYKSQNRSTNSIQNFEMVTTATDQTPYGDDVSCFNFLYADQLFSHYENPPAIGQNFALLQDNSWTETTGNNVFNFDTTWFPFPPLVDDEMQTGQVVQTDFEQ